MKYIEKKVVGTGAALNVDLGFVPTFVEVFNSDRDVLFQGDPRTTLQFDSGGTDVLEAGMTIGGASGGPTAVIEEIIVDADTWSAGTATGWIILSPFEPETAGSWANDEVIRAAKQKGETPSGDYATVNGAPANQVAKISTAVAAGGNNETITVYRGASGETGGGISIGSAISEDGKLLTIRAFGAGQG